MNASSYLERYLNYHCIIINSCMYYRTLGPCQHRVFGLRVQVSRLVGARFSAKYTLQSKCNYCVLSHFLLPSYFIHYIIKHHGNKQVLQKTIKGSDINSINVSFYKNRYACEMLSTGTCSYEITKWEEEDHCIEINK